MAIRKGKTQKALIRCAGSLLLVALFFLYACNVVYLEKFAQFDAHQGNYEEAVQDLTKAIRYAPRDPVPRAARAYLYQKMGRHDEAIADYTKAIELDPADDELYLMRGLAYSLKGDQDKAILDYSTAMEIDPHNSDACFNRAQAWETKGNLEQAVKDYQAAARLGNPRAQGILMARKIAW
ncbi:MAG TPA: tetratricopeptide repeat protein [Syntrophorhabdaceae bacterium]|nr:tetratricopeptide repeat protein [Syntrophorhabdaceae bacterium]